MESSIRTNLTLEFGVRMYLKPFVERCVIGEKNKHMVRVGMEIGAMTVVTIAIGIILGMVDEMVIVAIK